MNARINPCFLAGNLLIFPACSLDMQQEPLALVSEIYPEQTEAGAHLEPVIAALEAPDGAMITFIADWQADGEPAIGVEIVSTPHTPHTDALLAQEPSALELFLALVPGTNVSEAIPAALVRDHERLAEYSSDYAKTPRALTAPRVQGETVHRYDCSQTQDWGAAFMSWAPELANERINVWKFQDTIDDVGYAYKFYFDICRPAPLLGGAGHDTLQGPYITRVQRRPGSSNPWVTINQHPLALDGPERRWRYYRNAHLCSSHQYRLVVDTSGPYHRAARWSNEWSCTITQ